MSWPPRDMQPKPDESTNAIIQWGAFAPTGRPNQYPFLGPQPGQLQQWQQLTPQQEEYWRQQMEQQRMLNLQQQALVTLPLQQTALVPTQLNGGMNYLQWPYKDSAASMANHQLFARGSGQTQPAPSSSLTLEQLDRWWNDKQTTKKEKTTKKRCHREEDSDERNSTTSTIPKQDRVQRDTTRSKSSTKFKSTNSPSDSKYNNQHKSHAARRVQEHKNKVEVTTEEVIIPHVLLSHLKEHQLAAFKKKLYKNRNHPQETVNNVIETASIALYNLHEIIDAMGKPVPDQLKVEHQQLHNECAQLKNFTTQITVSLSRTEATEQRSKMPKITVTQDAEMEDTSDQKESSNGSPSSSSAGSRSSSTSSWIN